MWARLREQRATVYVQPDPTSLRIAELAEGQEFEVLGALQHGGERWGMIRLPGDRRGFLSQSMQIVRLHRVRTVEESTVAYAEPTETASPLVRYPKGSTLLVLGSATQDGTTWVKVRDSEGTEGFVHEQTTLQEDEEEALPELTLRRPSAERDAARRHMWVGGAWCAGGVAVTVGTYTAAAGGGTYVVAWGAIIFDALQFLRGAAYFL